MTINSRQREALIADITKWPRCQNPACALPIPYADYHRGAARWQRIKFCSVCCKTEMLIIRNKKRRKHEFKNCLVCKKEFYRPKRIAPISWAAKTRCPDCMAKGLKPAIAFRGSAFGKPIKPGFYPFTMIRERSGVFAEKVERQRPYPNCMETDLKSHRDEKINRIIEEMNYV